MFLPRYASGLIRSVKGVLPASRGSSATGHSSAETASREAASTAETSATATSACYDDGRFHYLCDGVWLVVDVPAVEASVYSHALPLGASGGLSQDTVGLECLRAGAAYRTDGIV